MIDHLLRSMEKRIPWLDARRMLSSAGYHPSIGWERTREKIEKTEQKGNNGMLEDYLLEHILCGDKYVKLYEIDAQQRAKLEAWFDKINGKIVMAGAASVFPLLLDDDELEKEIKETRFVSVQSNSDGVGVVLSSVFLMKAREAVEFQLFQNPKKVQGQFDEVFGLKLKRVQVLSVVWLPHERDHLEIRSDYPQGMSPVAVDGYHTSFKKLTEEGIGTGLGAAKNLFPAVRGFYEGKHDGRVTGITFRTPTGAIKNEQMLKQSDVDQREEDYHMGGLSALVEDISLYKIAVEWKRTIDEVTYRPTLALSASGPASSMDGTGPEITGVSIADCVRYADYELVIDRLGKMAGI